MMEKRTVEFKTPENVVIKREGLGITIKPFLSLAEMSGIINEYCSTYFSPVLKEDSKSIKMDSWRYFDADFAMKLAVLDFCTDMTVTEGAFENLFYDESIYNAVTKEILNYNTFLMLLYGVVDNIKKQIEIKKSIGAVVEGLGEKLASLLSQVSESIEAFKPEDIDALKKAGSELVDKIAENPMVKGVFAEASKK